MGERTYFFVPMPRLRYAPIFFSGHSGQFECTPMGAAKIFRAEEQFMCAAGQRGGYTRHKGDFSEM